MTLLIGCLLGACRTDPSQPVPARLVDPGPAAREELRATVETALHGTPVLLADDALTADSLLVVTHRTLRDEQGRPVMGRIVEPPARFQLVSDRGRCVLVSLDTSARWPLEHAACTPLPPPP